LRFRNFTSFGFGEIFTNQFLSIIIYGSKEKKSKQSTSSKN
jgi:hypothetical protein